MRLIAVSLTQAHVTVQFTYSNLAESHEPPTSIANDPWISLLHALGDRSSAHVTCGDHDMIATSERDGRLNPGTYDPDSDAFLLRERMVEYGRIVLDHMDAGRGSDPKEPTEE